MSKRKHTWKWKDEGSHRGEVTSSELHIGQLSISVYRINGLDQTQWFLTCHELPIKTSRKLLKPGTSLDKAKAHAINVITKHVDELHKLLHAHDY